MIRGATAMILETDFYGDPIGKHLVVRDRLEPVREIRYASESLRSILPEVKELLPAHYEELSVTKDAFPLDPDWNAYLCLEDEGVLHVITARSGTKLVGYIWGMLTRNLHYRSCKMAIEDIYYLMPEYRRGRTGIRLLQAFEKRMIALGANRIVITTKVHLDHTKILERLGYTLFEKGFTKTVAR